MINPMDLRESVQLEATDFEFRRLPTWMANATYFFGGNSLQLLIFPTSSKSGCQSLVLRGSHLLYRPSTQLSENASVPALVTLATTSTACD